MQPKTLAKLVSFSNSSNIHVLKQNITFNVDAQIAYHSVYRTDMWTDSEFRKWHRSRSCGNYFWKHRSFLFYICDPFAFQDVARNLYMKAACSHNRNLLNIFEHFIWIYYQLKTIEIRSFIIKSTYTIEMFTRFYTYRNFWSYIECRMTF